MKKALVLSLLMLAMSAVAFAGPSLNPWVEVNVPEIVGGVVPSPTLDAGITLEGMLSPAWFINVGFTYDDADLLDSDNDMGLGLNQTSDSTNRRSSTRQERSSTDARLHSRATSPTT